MEYVSFGIYLIASLALSGAVAWKIIPDAARHYGRTYFDWQETQVMSQGHRIGVTAASVAVVLLIAFRSNMHLLPGLTLIFSALIGTFVLDRYFQIIPDRFHLIGGAGVLWIWLASGLQGQDLQLAERLLYGPGLAAVLWACACLYEKFRHTPAMGLGDIKLFAWLGLVIGSDIIAVTFISMGLALIWHLPGLFLKKLKATDSFAFGPFIAAAAGLFLLM